MSSARSRVPALDATMARIDAWWTGAAPRERALVLVAGTLLALVILVYGVVKPLQGARAQALADIRTYEQLTARVRAAGTLTPGAPPRRQGEPAQLATAAAGGFGLAVTPQPMPGGVRLSVAETGYDTLLAWLADLAATTDLRVRRIDIVRGAAAGRVTATVELGA